MESFEELSEKAQKLAKKAAEKAVLDSLSTEVDEDNDEAMASIDAASDESESQSFDIFDYADELQKQGKLVTISVKKNGVLVASGLSLPLSWQDIQKKFGGGTYQVILKNAVSKRFLKAQTMMLADTEQKTQESEAKNTTLDLIAILEQKAKEAKKEAKEEAMRLAEMQAQQQNAMMQVLATALSAQKKDDSSLQLMQFMMQMVEKMNQNTMMLFSELNKKIESKQQDGPSWADVMKLTMESQNRGFEMWLKLEELAEAKAEEKAEMMREDKGDMTDALIKAVLPAVSTALVNNASQRASPAPVTRRIALPAQKKEALKREVTQAIKETVNLPSVDTTSQKTTNEATAQKSDEFFESLIMSLGDALSKAGSGEMTKSEIAQAIRSKITQSMSIESFKLRYPWSYIKNYAASKGVPEIALDYLQEVYLMLDDDNAKTLAH